MLPAPPVQGLAYRVSNAAAVAHIARFKQTRVGEGMKVIVVEPYRYELLNPLSRSAMNAGAVGVVKQVNPLEPACAYARFGGMLKPLTTRDGSTQPRHLAAQGEKLAADPSQDVDPKRP